MAILQFNGWSVTPEPSEMNVTVQDVSSSDSGRTQDAKMHKYVIAQKRTIAVSWNNIKQSEAQTIVSKLTANGTATYQSVTYDGDPFSSGLNTKTFYWGDISGAFQQVWVGNRKRYSKLSFTLIEQ